jgi:hypothetical protein
MEDFAAVEPRCPRLAAIQDLVFPLRRSSAVRNPTTGQHILFRRTDQYGFKLRAEAIL